MSERPNRMPGAVAAPGSPGDVYVEPLVGFGAEVEHCEVCADAAADALVARVAEGMVQNLRISSERIQRLIERRFPRMRGDRRWAELLRASIVSNVETAVHALRYGISAEGIPPPAPAVEYARRMAQHAVPSEVLMRSYRSGLARLQDEFVRRAADVVAEGPPVEPQTLLRAVRRMIRVSHEYIDSVSEQLLVVYADERDRWETGGTGVRAALVRRILDVRASEREIADAARDLGYGLDRPHVAALLWLPEDAERADGPVLIERASRRLGTLLRSSGAPLLVAADRVSAWAWYPMDPFRTAQNDDDLRAAWDAQWSGGPDGAQVPAPRRVSAAIGSVGAGIEGFRRSHRHAELARSVAVMSARGPGRATGYDEPGLSAVAMLCTDVGAAAAWVAEVLGRLAEDTDQAARMRETIRMFYLHGASHKAAATALHLHPNTVKYRVRGAEESLGRSLQDGRADIGLAVSICHWLGPEVLAR